MDESPFGFSYSWRDLRPVRPLFLTAMLVQLLGGEFGLWAARFPTWTEDLCTGLALATFPGFLLGLPIQVHLRPGSIVENRVMVRRMGLLALLFSVAAIYRFISVATWT